MKIGIKMLTSDNLIFTNKQIVKQNNTKHIEKIYYIMIKGAINTSNRYNNQLITQPQNT